MAWVKCSLFKGPHSQEECHIVDLNVDNVQYIQDHPSDADRCHFYMRGGDMLEIAGSPELARTSLNSAQRRERLRGRS